MMDKNVNYTLVNPKSKNLAFKLFSLSVDNSDFNHIQRLGYFAVVFIEKGQGLIKVDFNNYEFESGCVFTFGPFQPFVIETDKPIIGKCILFHPEFFCIYHQIQDVACDGVLFNNIYTSPITFLDAEKTGQLQLSFQQMISEIPVTDFAQTDMLISLLRICLINISRVKIQQHPEIKDQVKSGSVPFVLQDLKHAIEQNFKSKKTSKEYADLLNVTSDNLARACKKYFDKTLSNLIADRIVVEAKRELYFTDKPIKQIAFELGYNDEYYFSRLFKKKSEISPQNYRQSVQFVSV